MSEESRLSVWLRDSLARLLHKFGKHDYWWSLELPKRYGDIVKIGKQRCSICDKESPKVKVSGSYQ